MSQIIASSGQSFFDLGINAHGNLDHVYEIVLGGSLENLDSEIISGDVFVYTPIAIASPEIQSVTTSETSTIEYYFSNEGQSFFDVALMTHTNLDRITSLVLDSGFDSLNDVIVSGNKFTFDTTLISDNFFFNNLRQKNLVINTGDFTSIPAQIIGQRTTESFVLRITEDGNRRIIE